MSERAADALAAYWDALALGQSAEPLDVDLDPALADAVRRFQRVADVPGPRPEFVARLERSLARAGDAAMDSAPVLVHLHGQTPPGPSAPMADRARLDSPPRSPRRSPARWVAAHLATAALLLLTLAAGWAAIRGGPAPNAPLVPAGGAVETTPDPTTAQGLLLQATVDGVPSIAGYIAVERWSFASHSGPCVAGPVSGPMVYFVTAGRLTVTYAGPAQIFRGIGATRPTPATPGAPAEIEPGDSLVVPANVEYSLANDQAAPASAVVFSLLSAVTSDWNYPQFTPGKIQVDLLASDITNIPFPPGPTRIELRRATLAPGESIPAADPGTYQFVVGETKALAYLGRGSGGEATNKEAESLGVIVVTTRPATLQLAPPSRRASSLTQPPAG